MRRSVFSLLIALLGTANLEAQVRYPVAPGAYRPAPGYYPGYGGGYYPGAYGGMLSGAADVTRAQGDVMVQSEQARVLREKAEQEKLVTRKKTFDQMMYERENTPTYVERASKTEMLTLQRVMMKPTQTEVITGAAHNIMLPYIASFAQAGPMIPLAPALVGQINVTVPGKRGMGMLNRGVDNMIWPVGLLGTPQEKLAKSLDTAVQSVRSGKLNVKAYQQAKDDAKKLRADLDDRLDKEKVTMSEYAAASAFLESLNGEIGMLPDPIAPKILSGMFRAAGSNVGELVIALQGNGLNFAPACPGDEPAYQALFSAMVAFAQAAAPPPGEATARSPGGGPMGYPKK